MQSTNHYTEFELVQALQQKDQTAFSYLYDHYAGALNGIIYTIVKDDMLAQDILQEAFLKIWNNINQYDPNKGRIFTWMKTIAHNLTLDTLKSKQYKQQALVVKDEIAVINLKDMDDDHKRFNRLDLKNKIDQLENKQKIILDLSYFQGYTQEEIAKQLEMPVGSVKTKLRSAILALRKTVI